MITCYIGIVIVAVKSCLRWSGNFKYQCFTAALCSGICSCQLKRFIFCRRNLICKIALRQFNAPSSCLGFRHGQFLSSSGFIGIFQIVVIQRIVFVPIPYLFRQLECYHHFCMEDATTITVIVSGLAGHLGTIPENIAIVKVLATILIILTGFYLFQVFLISGKSFQTQLGFLRSHHIFCLQRRCLRANL